MRLASPPRKPRSKRYKQDGVAGSVGTMWRLRRTNRARLTWCCTAWRRNYWKNPGQLKRICQCRTPRNMQSRKWYWSGDSGRRGLSFRKAFSICNSYLFSFLIFHCPQFKTNGLCPSVRGKSLTYRFLSQFLNGAGLSPAAIIKTTLRVSQRFDARGRAKPERRLEASLKPRLFTSARQREQSGVRFQSFTACH